VTSLQRDVKCCTQGNVIRSTQGVQLLRGLEELDLRSNLISSIHEVVRLAGK
jgi:Leucine-rich repeat (LRR) protein